MHTDRDGRTDRETEFRPLRPPRSRNLSTHNCSTIHNNEIYRVVQNSGPPMKLKGVRFFGPLCNAFDLNIVHRLNAAACFSEVRRISIGYTVSIHHYFVILYWFSTYTLQSITLQRLSSGTAASFRLNSVLCSEYPKVLHTRTRWFIIIGTNLLITVYN